MPQKTRLSANCATIKDVREFLDLCETLGYQDNTLVGNHHTGLDLYVELPQRSTIYTCGQTDCEYETVVEACGLTADRFYIMPHHNNTRGYVCGGSGKKGLEKL